MRTWSHFPYSSGVKWSYTEEPPHSWDPHKVQFFSDGTIRVWVQRTLSWRAMTAEEQQTIAGMSLEERKSYLATLWELNEGEE